jgi:hypothetical protein
MKRDDARLFCLHGVEENLILGRRDNAAGGAELVYRIGFNPLHARIWRGK